MDNTRIKTISAASNASDLTAVLTFMQHVQPQINRSIELLEWQYLESPAGPGQIFTLWDDKILAAVYCAATQQVQVERAIFPARMVQDVMTHPHYRGRGFLHRLATTCLEEIKKDGAIGYTFPNELSQGSFRRTGWTELYQIPLRSKYINSTPPPSLGSVSVQELQGYFSPSASRIWDSSNLDVGVVRDHKFLNWRYKKPGQEYRSYLLNSNQGILVLKLYDNGSKRSLHICELFVNAELPLLVYDGLYFAESIARHYGAQSLTAWLGPHHPYAPYFLDAKFPLAVESKRFMFVTGPDTILATVEKSSRWHISQGDSDVY